MSKGVLLHPAERVDLVDLQYGLQEHPTDLQSDLMHAVYGAGVLDGFQVKILNQGQAPAAVEIYNGRALNWNGVFLENETGTNSERVVLTRSGTEYWIEVEFLWVDADPDSRAFWDPFVDNVDPFPDGQEVNIARVMTRRIPTWRVKTPINNNPTGLRSDTGYTPARFSPPSENTIPIAIIRTDNAGNIIKGDPNLTAIGNDISVYSTSVGTDQWFLKTRGYGETGTPVLDSGGNEFVYGLKTSDQRPRIFEPILPPFQYGVADELAGTDTLHDGWIRDLKSMYDHLTAQIAQTKLGSTFDDMGTNHICQLIAMSDDLSSVTLSSITDNGSPTAEVPSQTDQFIGVTFMIYDSSCNWNGFYARVRGNEKRNGAGQTILYLDPSSVNPEWKDRPNFAGSPAVCYLVQYRQNSWMTPPCPSSNNRGLNALDTEVVAGRTDWWSATQFTKLASRINAGKMAVLTVAPPDPLGTSDPDTGEPSTATHPRADIFGTAAVIQSKVNTVIASGKSGVIYFREGTYNFDSIADGVSIFEVKNQDALTFEGVGPQKTILERTLWRGPIFEVESAKDITFKNMTISGMGTTLSFIACSRVRFINCIIIADGGALTIDTDSIYLGAADSFYFENSIFKVTAEGIVATSLLSCKITGCTFEDIRGTPTETKYVFNIGLVDNTSIHDCSFNGYVSERIFSSSAFEHSHFHHNYIKANTSSTGSSPSLLYFGTVNRSMIDHIPFSSISSSTSTQTAISCLGVLYSVIEHIDVDNVSGGFTATSLYKCCLHNLVFDLVSSSDGISITGNVSYTSIKDCKISGEGNLATGLSITGNISQLIITDNQFRGSGGNLPYAMDITSSTIEMLSIYGNHAVDADRVLHMSGLGITNGNSVSIHHNNSRGGLSNAYQFKVRGSLYNFIFESNHVRDCGDIALSIDSTGCIVYDSKIEFNILEGKTRGLEIWSSNGGSFSECSFVGNKCISQDKTPIAIGVSSSGAVPAVPSGAIPSLVLYGCDFNNNTSKPTGTCVGGIYVSDFNWGDFSGNKVLGTPSLYGIKFEFRLSRSSFSRNNVIYSTTSGHGIVFGKNVFSNELIGNHVELLSGATTFYHGFLVTNPAPGYNIIDNVLSNNFVEGDKQAGSYCYSLEGIDGWTITGNRAKSCDIGFYMVNANHNAVSGNFIRDVLTSYMDVTGGDFNMGGHIVIGAPVAGWTNDHAGSNILSDFNVGMA